MVEIRHDYQVKERQCFTVRFSEAITMTPVQKYGSCEAGSKCKVTAMMRRTDCMSGVMFKVRVEGKKTEHWLDAGWFKETRYKK